MSLPAPAEVLVFHERVTVCGPTGVDDASFPSGFPGGQALGAIVWEVWGRDLSSGISCKLT